MRLDAFALSGYLTRLFRNANVRLLLDVPVSSVQFGRCRATVKWPRAASQNTGSNALCLSPSRKGLMAFSARGRIHPSFPPRCLHTLISPRKKAERIK